MAILVKPDTKVLIQGITGSFGARHAQLSIEYGSQVVAGVTPGKGGQMFAHNGRKVPIFDTVMEAVKQTAATASAVFVPPPFAADAILEGVNAGLELVVAITEGIPVRDMIQVKRVMEGKKTRLIGPNCPGVVTPGDGKGSHGGCRIGISPGYIHSRGNIGVVSRSGTLTYEAVWQLTCRGLGQSTCVGIGGDPVHGTSHLEVIELFMADPETKHETGCRFHRGRHGASGTSHGPCRCHCQRWQGHGGGEDCRLQRGRHRRRGDAVCHGGDAAQDDVRRWQVGSFACVNMPPPRVTQVTHSTM
jgi:succinyl-CoA synthetase alpha subunit